MADFHTLSILERRHIIETIQETLRQIREQDEYMYPLTDDTYEDLKEILRILGADDVEE